MSTKTTFSPNTKIKSAEVNQIWSVDWTNWTPGYTGFSANPTTNYAKYCVIGNVCYVGYYILASGTSNSTAFTITGFPVAIAVAANGMRFNLVDAIDNGGFVSTGNGPVGLLTATTLTVYKDGNATAWTAANGKYINSFLIAYPIDP